MRSGKRRKVAGGVAMATSATFYDARRARIDAIALRTLPYWRCAMTDLNPEGSASDPQRSDWDAGGLHFAVSFRAPAGATLRISGPVRGARQELLRFDDFVDSPHYHAPGEGEPIMFDRATLGEPLDWIVDQIRDHLEELLTSAGLAAVLSEVDTAAVADSAERIKTAMIDCVPDGYVRVPGVGLQRAGSRAG